jgi:uncharacterized protein
MDRQYYLEKIRFAFKANPVVALLGPRQCGKTFLARSYIALYAQIPPQNYFDLERISDVLRLSDPEYMLSQLEGLMVIDEIQRMPELFDVIRVLVDRPGNSATFLILGSASRQLVMHSSNTLAGRVSFIELTPFSGFETGEINHLFLRGGFPRSYLAESDEVAFEWLQNYIRTYLEQDIPNLGIQIAPNHLRRFWIMLSHYHGGIFNASDLGRSLSMSYHTVQNYLDILTGTFMVRRLNPWFENISKRQVKSPKIYIRDPGILFSLLGIQDESALLLHPKLGAAWEGFAIEQVMNSLHADPDNCFFWATHASAKLDLLILHKGQRLGFEFKYGSAVTATASMKSSIQDLHLDRLTVIYSGDKRYKLAEKIEVIPLIRFVEDT